MQVHEMYCQSVRNNVRGGSPAFHHQSRNNGSLHRAQIKKEQNSNTHLLAATNCNKTRTLELKGPKPVGDRDSNFVLDP